MIDGGSDIDPAILQMHGTDVAAGLDAHEHLAAAKIDPVKLPVVSTSIAEDELRSLLPAQVAGHYCISAYFQSLDSPANRE